MTEKLLPGASVERRPYFIFGDLLANVVAGGAAGCVASLLVREGWLLAGQGAVTMFVAMGVGMVAGMMAAMLPLFLLMPLFGAMELMLPAMLTGMLSGMSVAMVDAMHGMPWSTALVAGALVGVVVLVLTYLLNAGLSGKVRPWTS